MITADPMPVFPACPTFGFTSEPMYRVARITRDSGAVRRDRKWSRPLHRYSGVPLGEKAAGDIQEVLYFWHAMGGGARTFRFKDWADHKSCKVDETPDASNWAPIVPTDDSPPELQLVKRYTYGAFIQDREIRHPVGNTIVIANDEGEIQAENRWTLDEATGLVVPELDFVGTPYFWSGEFDVPCYFDSELPVELTNHNIERVTVSFCEEREP